THNASAPPDLGDVGQVQIVADVFGQVFAGCILEDVEALGIGLHHSVLDAVVHHLDEVSGARGPAVDVSVFGGAAHFFASGSACDVAPAGRQGLKDGIEAADGIFRSADHHAIAALQPPNTAAGADLHVIYRF